MNKEELIYPGQTVCVMGLGVTGRAAVRYCLSKGAHVFVSDARSEAIFLREEGSFLQENKVTWEAGGHSYDFLVKSSLLLPSPGIDLHNPLFASLIDVGVKIAGELAVMADQIDVPVVAETGTNGKTSVTSLIGEVLKGADRRVFVGGNIGTPLYEYLLTDRVYDVVVVELSSFQLECSGNFCPNIGVLLNITPDHLDRHKTMESYIDAKERVFTNMVASGLAIVSGDDPICRKVSIPDNVEIMEFGRSKSCFLQVSETNFLIRTKDNGQEKISLSLKDVDGFASYNYAAAFLALRQLGLSVSDIRKGFEEFNALPHRLEFAGEVCDISFINDSKATNTGAVIGALGQMKGKVILIAGGRDKGDDYNLLRPSIEEKVNGLVLIGEAAAQIEESLGDLVECKRALTMEDAVKKAHDMAKIGDTVLLSPACASFDMFSSYGNRGDVFKKAVLTLAEQKRLERGGSLVK